MTESSQFPTLEMEIFDWIAADLYEMGDQHPILEVQTHIWAVADQIQGASLIKWSNHYFKLLEDQKSPPTLSE